MSNTNLIGEINLTEENRQGIYDAGHGRFVTRWEYHLVHCAYVWEFMERAYHRGIDDRDDSDGVWIIPEFHEEGVEHTEHCGTLWAKVAREGMDNLQVLAFASKGAMDKGFKSCTKLARPTRGFSLGE